MTNPQPSAPTYQGVTSNTLAGQYAEAPDLYQNQATYSPMYAALGAGNVNTALTSPAGILNSISAGRTGDVGDLTKYGPGAANAVLNANPAQAQMLAQLNGSAAAGVAAGSTLTPDQQRMLQQQSRGNYASRGMTGSGASIADELMRQYQYGQGLQTQRQQFAGNVAGANNNYVTNPAMSLAMGGTPGINFALGTNAKAGPTLWNPQAADQLMAGEYQSQLGAAAATPTGMQNTVAFTSALSSEIGGAAKMAM